MACLSDIRSWTDVKILVRTPKARLRAGRAECSCGVAPDTPLVRSGSKSLRFQMTRGL